MRRGATQVKFEQPFVANHEHYGSALFHGVMADEHCRGY